MVTVTNFMQRESADGKPFFLLELSGDLEIVSSQQTGRQYATIRKVSIPTTFNEQVCRMMVGKQLSGQIIKVETEEPYEYTIKDTGEVIQLNYRYAYSATEQHQTMEQAVFS